MPSNTFDDWIGRQVGEQGRYRLQKILGSGGMGAVFVAEETKLGKTVAIKFLKENFKDDPDCLKRFEREASISVALAQQSQHIAQIEDYGVTEDGYPYFVMELLQGQTLGQRLKETKFLPLSKSLDIFRQICLGLKTAHNGVQLWRQGQVTPAVQIIHRDLKPENIFLVPTTLGESGEWVKILDFGIAKIYGDVQYTNLTHINTFLGSCAYASPEQLQSASDVDQRSDIYSLGMLLYRMLSGNDPFGFTESAASVNPTLWGLAHITKPPAPLASQPYCHSLDPRLTAMVDRCLAKLPEDRFESVEQLLQALSAIIADGFSPTDPVTDTALTQLSSSQIPAQPAGDARVEARAGTESPGQSAGSSPAVYPLRSSPQTSAPQTGTNNSDHPTASPPESSQHWQTQNWRTLIPKFILAGLGVTTVALGVGFWRQSNILGDIQRLREQSQFEQCIQKANEVHAFFPSYAQAQIHQNACRLAFGKQLALDKQTAKAIAVVTPIPAHDPSFPEAKMMKERWSSELYLRDPGPDIVDPCTVPDSIVFPCIPNSSP
jgi:eukaryotic-like serine/threonine-protein kinase